ncbi:MAG TPA: AMP-binding protein, partial [Chloroflexota bacterium]|nr:AMP-binding protein [Chloroflexota bacterium]
MPSSNSASNAAHIIRSAYPDVAIPEVPLTEFVLGDAARHGEKPALIDGASGRTITYAQLTVAIKRAAAGLAAKGFKKGDVLAIYAPNVPEYAIAFHAVASLGGISTTVNPLYTTDELAHQLEDCEAKYLLTVPPLLEKAVPAKERVHSVQEIIVFGEAEGCTPFATLLANDGEAPNVAIDPKNDLVTLPYSSGTTGLPKGVMLTHHNLVAELTLAGARDDLAFPGEQDTLLAFLPFFHIYGIVMFLDFALWRGATVVTMTRFDLEQFLGMVEKYRVTYLHIVPPIALALAKHPIVDKFDLSKAKWALSAAAPLGEQVASAFTARLGTKLFQAYGMTEVSGATHIGSCREGELKAASGGRLLPNTECVVVDPATGEAVERNKQGEIWVRGPLNMRGYLRNPDATAATIDADGWLHTGDVGYVDDDGDVFIVDRVKELIKYKGMQVAPAELEAILLGHPAVSDAAVIPSPDEEAGEVPKAFIVVKQPTPAEDIMAFVAAKVAPYKKIRKLQFIDAIPKSASGK